jgi:hypothetical protein
MIETSNMPSMYHPPAADEQPRNYQYTIAMEDTGETLVRYKTNDVYRDRRVYSKLLLKQFLRGSVSREAWIGAPWVVKDHLARRYRIPTKVPDMKTRDAVMAAKRAHTAMNNGALPPPNHLGMGPRYMDGAPLMRGPGQGSSELINLPGIQVVGARPIQYLPPPPYGYPNNHHPPFATGGPPHYINLPQPPVLNHPHPPPHHGPQPPAHVHAHYPQQQSLPSPGLPITLPFPQGFMSYQRLPTQPANNAQPQQTQPPNQPPAPPVKPFEPIKYPIEDLRIKSPRMIVTRPTLKFFSDDVPDGAEPPADDKKTGIHMKSIGPMLCIWDTLNVHDTIYYLDSFTLDDFVEAIGFSSEEIECELLTEMHCAVLKQYLDKHGKIQVELPPLDDEESDTDESSEESTPEPEPPVRTTRSSLRKSEANQLAKQRTPSPEPPKQLHKAAEFLQESDFDWVEQIKIRNFRDGGWQAVLVGLLHRLSVNPVHKDTCDEILAQLVPPDEDPTIANIAYNYVYMDVNLRIAALDIALRLTVTTEPFREQLNLASQELTRLRKEKIEHQRKRKELYV